MFLRMFLYIIGCDINQLVDGEIINLSDESGIQCGLPLFTAGITKEGVVCYTGTHVGAIAMYHCFDCGFNQASSGPNQVRTCMLDGTWNGTAPRCGCNDKGKMST